MAFIFWTEMVMRRAECKTCGRRLGRWLYPRRLRGLPVHIAGEALDEGSSRWTPGPLVLGEAAMDWEDQEAAEGFGGCVEGRILRGGRIGLSKSMSI
jgi:hypothetical protein